MLAVYEAYHRRPTPQHQSSDRGSPEGTQSLGNHGICCTQLSHTGLRSKAVLLVHCASHIRSVLASGNIGIFT